MENKYQEYQEALDYIESIVIDEDVLRIFDSPNYPTLIKNHIKLLQELVDKEKPYTFEEVKKEWEELGYEVKIGHFPDVIVFNGSSDDGDNIIYLFLKDKTISFGEYSRFSIKEHQLLTKTFKALGWYDE